MATLIHAMLQLSHQRWWLVAAVSSALAAVAACVRIFESEAARQKRLEATKEKELQALTDKISIYGRNVRERFPNGAVVVSEEDLAAQLRQRPDTVVTALQVLLKEQKVQRAPLSGYWRLNA